MQAGGVDNRLRYLFYRLFYAYMRNNKKRELATVNIRIYPSTRKALSALSFKTGKTIARLVSDMTCETEKSL